MSNIPSSIVCFKNGYSFVSIPVSLKGSDEDVNKSSDQVQSCTLGPLPDEAVHGTIGLQPGNPVKVKILSLSKAPKNEKRASVLAIPDSETGEFSVPAYLGANVGKNVILTISNSHGMDQTEVGKIEKVLNAANGSFVVIEKSKRSNDYKADMLIDISLIRTVQGAVDEEDDINQPRIIVRYHDASEQESEAVLSYLTPGLTWAPSYFLVLDKTTKTLQLEGKACLMCDLSFLKGDIIPEVCLVTGQPNMFFQNIADPLVSDQSASDFVQNLEGGGGPVSYPNYGGVTRQTARRSAGPRAPRAHMQRHNLQSGAMFGSSQVENSEGIDSGETVEDFFHYILKNVPIKCNHPIRMDFINKVPRMKYEDVYLADLNTVDMDNRGTVEVKHAISFKNTTGQPLTTAPATVLSKAETNSKFLVQALMKYCWPDHDANLEITSTHDVQVNFSIKSEESTKEREKDSEYIIHSILKNCEVLLVNYKQERVKCKVEYSLRGELAASDPEVKKIIEKNIVTYNIDINPHAKYVWEIILDPKEQKKIAFSYLWKERRPPPVVQKGLFN